ncbi:hypothetical protein ACWDBD_41345 [Streptomyces sp. NPDC001118]
MPAVIVPRRSTSNSAPIAQRQRLALLRRLVNRGDVPLQDRVAAALVRLYAQPLTRITKLSTDGVQHENGRALSCSATRRRPFRPRSTECCWTTWDSGRTL